MMTFYIRKSWSCMRGAAAVEFAIVVGLLALILGGVIEFGRAFWYYDAITKATRDAARYMTTVPKQSIATEANAAATASPYSTSNPLSARSIIVNAVGAAGVPSLTGGNISITCLPVACQNGVAPGYVSVAITNYQVDLGSWFPLPFGVVAIPLEPWTTMRYMR